MLWVWLWQSVIWLVKLPFYLLPGSTFLPLPAPLYNAVNTLGAYCKWFVYLFGDSVGDAVVLVVNYAAPLLLVLWFWRLLASLLKTAGFAVIGGRMATGKPL